MRRDLRLCLYVVSLLGSVVLEVHGLGSMSTFAASFDSNGNGSATVCGIVVGGNIQCEREGRVISVWPNVSFVGISGGDGFFCGLREGRRQLLCWDTADEFSRLSAKRISKRPVLSEVAVGENHLCGLVSGARDNVLCWRGNSSNPRGHFSSISAGGNFSCGISAGGTARCWGLSGAEIRPPRGIANASLESIAAGGFHACGIRTDGVPVCWGGRNESGELKAPSEAPFEYASLALGENRSCAIRRRDKTAVCWGAGLPGLRNASFESIVAGDSFACGLLSQNFSVLCWGGRGFESGRVLSLPSLVPGICAAAEACPCGVYPDSESYCSESAYICSPCAGPGPGPGPGPAAPPASPRSPAGAPTVTRTSTNKGLLAFAIVGSAGTLAGASTLLWCIWLKCFATAGPNGGGLACNCYGGQGRVHNSAAPAVAPVRSASIRRQTSRGGMRRQRSGTSKRSERAEGFALAELRTATDNFSDANIIGAGSYGVVYRGKLADGREVAIKRGDVGLARKFQEKESAFQSELAFLSRVHHKNLVSLVGFCEEEEERMLVYEYMPNGALYDHLHKRDEAALAGAGAGAGSSLLHSWVARVKVALDAARGIEYLHTYAVPPIIHRDIKSSNILLDSSWTARVSDFGLSLMGPEAKDAHLSLTAAGTVGYMDPEYYRLRHLTPKSDVYGFGVVLLEILTGQRAIHKQAAGPISIVDYAVPRILSDELHQILDPRVRPPRSHEIEAVELVAYTAVLCVNLEGKDRPSMTDIVANLERAVAICTQASFSRSASMVITSDDAQ